MTVDEIVRPFAGLRPAKGRAADVAAPPYDVVSEAEARGLVAGRPWSFLHVSRPEVDFPDGIDSHAPECYVKAAENLRAMERDGVLIRDVKPCYYVYRMILADHVQTGVVAGGSIAEYARNRIRRHELTRPDKETDRVRQIDAVDAQTGPVLVAHPRDSVLDEIVERATGGAPAADVSLGDVRHQMWVVSADADIDAITGAFGKMDAIYIADGHHRSAAAARVAEARGDALSSHFLIVSFPIDEVKILDYNRVVRDLGGLSAANFVSKLGQEFDVVPMGAPVRPDRRGTFGLYLGGRWYRLVLKARPGEDASPLDRLDVRLLTAHVLDPLLGIGDPRTDPRIDFVGGIRGLEALQAMVDGGEWQAAFSLFPTGMDDLMAVADAGLVMPPKSTWFEPKLADGLISYPLA